MKGKIAAITGGMVVLMSFAAFGGVDAADRVDIKTPDGVDYLPYKVYDMGFSVDIPERGKAILRCGDTELERAETAEEIYLYDFQNKEYEAITDDFLEQKEIELLHSGSYLILGEDQQGNITDLSDCAEIEYRFEIFGTGGDESPVRPL